MKKLIIALSTIFCAVLVAVSIYTIIPSKSSKEDVPKQQQETYFISDYEGKVALFKNGEKDPVKVYEIYTHLLPENDIELLRKGIAVENETQLQSRLEDFGL